MFRNLARESIQYGVTKVAAAGIGFFTLPFFTRSFSMEDYGILTLVATIVSLLPLLYGLSLETAFTRYFNDGAYTPPFLIQMLFKFFLIHGLFLSCAFTALGFFLLTAGNFLDYLSTLFIVLAGAFISNFLTVYTNFARMTHNAKDFAIVSLTTTFVGALASIFFVYFFKSVFFYFLGAFIGLSAGLLVAAWIIKLPIRGSLASPLGRIKPLLRFSIPLIPAAAAMYLNSHLDCWAIAYYLGKNDVAIYAVGAKLASIAALGVSILMFAFLPHSMKLIQAEKSEADYYLERSLRYFTLVCICGSVVLQLLAPVLLKFLAPSEYAPAYRVVGLLAFSAVLFGYTYFSTLGSWRVSHAADYSIAIVLGFILNVFFNFILIPVLGIVGAAIATVIGMLSTVLVSFYLSYRRYPYEYSYWRFFTSNLVLIIWLGVNINAGADNHDLLVNEPALLAVFVLFVSFPLCLKTAEIKSIFTRLKSV